MKPPFGWEEIADFVGWKDEFIRDLPSWERQMVLVPAPKGFRFLYDGKPTKGIRMHGAVAAETRDLLLEISAAGLWRFVESTGGGYNFRTQRGSKKLSMHSLGLAFDSDPARNALGVDPDETALGTEPGLGVVRIAQARGWTWGGIWQRPDSMHFNWGGGF